MDQLVKSISYKLNTQQHRGHVNCGPGFGGLYQVYGPNHPTHSTYSICGICNFTICAIRDKFDILVDATVVNVRKGQTDVSIYFRFFWVVFMWKDLQSAD